MAYLSALDRRNWKALRRLEEDLTAYYHQPNYHDSWIKGINADWNSATHPAQVAACERIPPRSRLMEVGCGDGSAAREIQRRTEDLDYLGVDVNAAAWRSTENFRFEVGSATNLRYPDGSFSVVLSMFAIEHLVFPHLFLDSAVRILKPRGRLLIVAPDFLRSPMASERIGFSYGSGSSKLRKRQLLDALVTGFDTRVRLRRQHRRRESRLRKGEYWFPVLITPRCLTNRSLGFVPDCDAVYPVCPEEIINYLSQSKDYGRHEIFHRSSSAFGLLIEKR